MTKYLDRFQEALTQLCDVEPPVALCKAWLRSESDGLQDWVGGNLPPTLNWSTAIGVIEAAEHIADNPEEGAGHEGCREDFTLEQSQEGEQ